MIQTFCKVSDISQLSDQIYIVRLIAEEKAEFNAGQYLEFLIPEIPYAYFTIASAPHEEWLEIHIIVPEPESRSQKIVDYLQQYQRVEAKIGMGNCHLDMLTEEKGPLLLVTAGTGFSQAKAICEDLIHRKQADRKIHLYWGVRKASDLYMNALPEQWHEQYPWLHYCAVVSDQLDWEGKQGLLYQAIQADFEDLSQCQAICCGSPAMVNGTLDEMMKHHFREDQMLSDVFEFAPRKSSAD